MAREPHLPDLDEDPVVTELRRLTSHHYLRKQRTWPRMIWYNVVRGMAFGFGSLVGATVIVYIVIAILTQMVQHIDFIPLLSEWITTVVEIVEASQGSQSST